MRYLKILFIAVFASGLFACASSGHQPDPIIASEQKKNERLAKQSSKEMYLSKKIPSVEFEFDSLKLAPSAYPILDKIAGFMVGNEKIKLIVEGHTDSVGSHEYNDWLSLARAMAIKSYLVSRGIYPDSIKVYGYGKRRPLTYDDTPEGRATNRRVVFTVTDRDWNAVY